MQSKSLSSILFLTAVLKNLARLRTLGYEPLLPKRGLAELPAIRRIYTDRVLTLLQINELK